MIAVDIPLAIGLGEPKQFLSTIKNAEMGRWADRVVVRHEGSRAVVKWQLLKTSWAIRLEFNPSRFQDPDGYSLAMPEATQFIVQKLVEENMFTSMDGIPEFALNDFGEIQIDDWHPNWREMIRVARLDTSVDFLIPDPDFNLGLYSSIRPKYAKATRITFDGGPPETWEGVYKTRDGVPKMYNKYQKAKEDKLRVLPPEGLYRFEFQYGRKSLARAHIHTLADVTSAKFEQALRSGWERSNLSTSVFAENAWMRLIGKSLLPPKIRAEVIGFLQAELGQVELGYGVEEMTDVKAWAREAGINFKKELINQGDVAMALDLESQRLIYY